jgi:carotenoid phi-ring synthase / carotenoid chi-ring synthase
MEEHKVIIIGAGLAGLTAGLHLAERGVKPLILEADPAFCGGRVGGKPGATFTNANGQTWHFAAEHGIHGLWKQYRNFKAQLIRNNIAPQLVKAKRQEWVHGVGDKVKRAEMGWIVRRTILPAPYHYGALFFRPAFWRMLTARDIFAIPQVLGSLIVASGVDPLAENITLEGKSLADFCQGWSPAMNAFVASLGRSGLSAHPDQVPLSGFIAFLRFYTLLRRDSQAFEYLAESAETALIAPLLKRITELGGAIRQNQRVSSLDKVGDSWQVCIEGQSVPLSTQAVILATDATATRQILLNSEPTREIAETMTFPKGLETAVVRFWFKNAPRNKAEAGIVSGDFAVDNFFWLHRFQNQFSEWHKATGGSAVEMHIYRPGELEGVPDEELVSRALSDITRIYPILQNNLLHSTFRRNPPTHTLFAVGSLAQHLGVRTVWRGLYACGDWVRHTTPALFLERATVTGIHAANAVLESFGQPTFPVVPPAKPELLARITGAWVRMMRTSVRGTNPKAKN